MALVFRLYTAFLATHLWKWVRNYVFQRYSDPRLSVQLRQYLHDSAQVWYMLVVAEVVPSLLHISLFLFMTPY